MATRAVFLSLSAPYWINVAQTLHVEQGWEIVYWSGSEYQRDSIQKLFPHCIFNTDIEDLLMQGKTHSEAWPNFQIDEERMLALARTKDVAMTMMDRMDPTGRDFPTAARRRHFRRLANYWGGVFQALKPDVLIFDISPHLVFDYIAYELAKLMGIRTIMFDRTGLQGHLLTLSRFEDGSDELRETYAQALDQPDIKLSEFAKSYWETSGASGGRSMAPLYQAKMKRLGIESASKKQQVPGKFRIVWRELRQLYYFFKRNGFGAQDVYWMQPGADVDKTRLNFGQLAWSRFQGLKKRASLRRYAEKLFVHEMPDDDHAPYILLALHYQPERATLPLGGAFSDQVAMASMLAHALPEGWKLLIKEHPWQLHPYSKGHLQRDKSFYDDLASLPNTGLLRDDCDTEMLIDGAKAVATITGSVGWQAMARGKPALVFGAAWYRDCQGAYEIQTIDNLKSALNDIASGICVSPKATQAYLCAIEDIAVRAYLEPKGEAQFNIDNEKNAKAIADAIVTFFNDEKRCV